MLQPHAPPASILGAKGKQVKKINWKNTKEYILGANSFSGISETYDHKCLKNIITNHNSSRSCSCFYPPNSLKKKVTEVTV